jgi:hypothetical protein
MTTSTLGPVAGFADAVRHALADLPPDEVDELTDGLEADLAERADDADAGADFGDPVAYADELRAAAGLRPRTRARTASGLDATVTGAWRDLVDGWRGVASNRQVRRLGAFFVSLRPLWWVFRAWVIYSIVAALFGQPTLRLSPLTFLIGLGALVVSVQWGRGRWQARAWVRYAVIGFNVLLVLCVPIVLIATSSAVNSEVANAANAEQAGPIGGIVDNGKPVSNIFAYDANGNPLSGVQLFDQDGKPLSAVSSPSATRVSEVGDDLGRTSYLVPSLSVPGRIGWNVYPLDHVSARDLGDNGLPTSHAVPVATRPRAASIPGLAQPAPTPTATPTPTVTPTPTPRR